MIYDMLNFVKFLGIAALILFLIAIIQAIINTIYENTKLIFIKRKALKKIKKQVEELDLEKMIVKEDVK